MSGPFVPPPIARPDAPPAVSQIPIGIVAGAGFPIVSLIVLQEDITGYSGLFGYTPSPGPGNLVFSLTASGGTDPYGNTYVGPGMNFYDSNGPIIEIRPDLHALLVYAD